MGVLNEIRNQMDREGDGEYDANEAKKLNNMIEDLELTELTMVGGHLVLIIVDGADWSYQDWTVC